MMNVRYDAVVVGARCAGATLATLLARAGQRVLLVDGARFPSDTVSTHMMFPDTLDRLDRLGVMRRLTAEHRLAPVRFGWRVLGHEVAGDFTPVGGYDRGTCVRRIVLDAALVGVAAAAGAEVRFGQEVAGLLGAGSADDPVRGVVLGTGERVESRWVFGADGRVSTVARRLGLQDTWERAGGMGLLLAYWRGLPASEWCHIDVHERAALMSVPCEDGIHLLSLGGPPEITRGSVEARERRYHEGLRQFPAVLNARLLDTAERISPLVVVPETMMRGHRRAAAGPGWALLGDAGIYTHPVTAQGIGDAVHQAWYVADALAAGDDLSGYQQWRDGRVEEHYGWSFDLARFGSGEVSGDASGQVQALYSGLAADPVAGRQFLDVFTKRNRPSEVVTPRRVARWTAAWAYEDARRRVRSLVQDLDDAALATVVPACPEWTVRDLLAHLAGVAEDSVRGEFFPGAVEAWRDPALAGERERWTAGHVAGRAGSAAAQLLQDLDDHGGRLAAVLRRDPRDAAPDWLAGAPVGDIAVHLLDLHEALGVEPDDAAPSTKFGFAVYRAWLHLRITERGLPALRLSDGVRDWVAGDGPPAATVTASRRELFRAVSGRRSAARIRGYAWDGDPAPYLPVVAPYPLPPDEAPLAVAVSAPSTGTAARPL
jgi:uncharacterized protein (TIGR03083 family)